MKLLGAAAGRTTRQCRRARDARETGSQRGVWVVGGMQPRGLENPRTARPLVTSDRKKIEDATRARGCTRHRRRVVDCQRVRVRSSTSESTPTTSMRSVRIAVNHQPSWHKLQHSLRPYTALLKLPEPCPPSKALEAAKLGSNRLWRCRRPCGSRVPRTICQADADMTRLLQRE